MQDSIGELADLIAGSHSIVVFSGAGISTESGISDYRSKGGLWDRFQPVTIQEFLVDPKRRREYWQQKLELYESFHTAEPNDAHGAAVILNGLKKLKGCITQNIDGLYQMAGLPEEKIIELHGTNRTTVCLSCGDIREWTDVYGRLKKGEAEPLCTLCNGLLKPNTVSFGQSLNPGDLQSAVQWAGECDLMLALGSTLIVEPAASLPRIAVSRGARLVIITLGETPLDGLADLKIEAKVAQTLKQTMDSVLSKIKKDS